MHLPVGGEERLDILGGEKIRRAMRPIQHADFPLVAVAGNQRPCGRRRARAGRQADSSESAGAICSTSPVRRVRPAWPPKLPEGEGGWLPR